MLLFLMQKGDVSWGRLDVLSLPLHGQNKKEVKWHTVSVTFLTYGTTYLPEAVWGGHAYFDSRFQGFTWESVVIAKTRQTKWLGLWWLVPADCRQDAEFKPEVGVGDNCGRPWWSTYLCQLCSGNPQLHDVSNSTTIQDLHLHIHVEGTLNIFSINTCPKLVM